MGGDQGEPGPFGDGEGRVDVEHPERGEGEERGREGDAEPHGAHLVEQLEDLPSTQPSARSGLVPTMPQ